MSESGRENGWTLIEAVVALFVLGIVLMGMVPGFLVYMDSNSRNELRSGAIQASRATLESLRLAEPSTLPASGSTQPQTVVVNDLQYSVVTHFCQIPQLCDSQTRLLTVEVSFEGNVVYDAETVFTELR